MFSKYITIKTQFNGCHYYKDAPQEVSFLKNTHRHRFFVECTISVKHSDRELEFYMVQDFVEGYIKRTFIYETGMSCEMYAEQIAERLLEKYGQDRQVVVKVAEDGLQYATVTNMKGVIV